ncbi:MAG: XylR family transcriptional regulator [Planctomycetaceae bacterium]|nr:XylR family transcriptional regulator [Planctomycetaceae bacterium]
MTNRPRVAILVESSRGYGRGLLQGIADYLRVHGPWSVFFEERDLSDPPPDWLVGWKGQGVIARIETRALAKAISDLDCPAIDLHGLLPDLGMPLIDTDDRAVTRLAIEHLLERGFRHLAYCGFVGTNYSDRRSGYFTQRVEEMGLTPLIYQPPARVRLAGTERQEQQGWMHEDDVARWVSTLPRPVGLMACNDIRGQQVLNTCREAGIAVPDEVAVVGVDNDEILCDLAAPPLSSVAPNTRRIGYEAAELLTRIMAGEPAPTEPILIEPLGVVTRQSSDVLAVGDRDVAAAVRYIREHACKGIMVDDVLAVVPVSRSILERRFTQILGHSPKEEISRVRLRRIKQLLAETDLSLAQVATMTGFQHPEYLNVMFKSKTGQTPGEYRTATRRQPLT